MALNGSAQLAPTEAAQQPRKPAPAAAPAWFAEVQRLHREGYAAALIPVCPANGVPAPGTTIGKIGKSPATRVGGYQVNLSGWQNGYAHTLDQVQIGQSCGILGLHVVGIDIDTATKSHDPARVAAAQRHAEAIEAIVTRELGSAPCRVGLPPKRLLPYRNSEGIQKQKLTIRTPDGDEYLVEVIGVGGQWVAEGVHPDTQKRYEWPRPLPPIKQLPQTTKAKVTGCLQAIADYFAAEGCTVSGAVQPRTFSPSQATPQPSTGTAHPAPEKPKSRDPHYGIDDLKRDLAALRPERADDREMWYRVCIAVARQFEGTPSAGDALAELRVWSTTSGKYREGDEQHIWKSARDHDTEVTVATLRYWAEQDVQITAVEKLNERYRYNRTRGAQAVMEITPSGLVHWHSLAQLKEAKANETVRVGKKQVPVMDIWHKSAARATDHGLVFAPNLKPLSPVPSKSGVPGETDFNLWPGFATTPSPTASCDRFLDHLLQVICGGDKRAFRWVTMWLAAIVQRPAEPVGTCLVLRGPEGAGKSILSRVMAQILGKPLYVEISDPKGLTGQFNAHLAGKLLAGIEEAFWAGAHDAEGQLKRLITSDSIQIEEKYANRTMVENYLRLLITSNSAWVVPAGLSSRRFSVFDVAADRKDDLDYHRALRRQMFDEDGCAAFMQYLLQLEIDYDVLRRPCPTAALVDQQVLTQGPDFRWLFDQVSEGALFCDDAGDGLVFGDFVQRYIADMRSVGAHRLASADSLGRLLTRVFGDAVSRVRQTQGPTRARGYQFPALPETRRLLAAHLAVEPTWSNQTDHWQAADVLVGGEV